MELTLKDRLITDLRQIPVDRKRLQKTTAPLEQKWLSRRIADMERLLAVLEDRDRLIIETVIVNGGKASALTDATGLTAREIQRVKDNALESLCYYRYGAGYRP